MIGEWVNSIQNMIRKQPESHLQLVKSTSGDPYILGIYSNKFQDREGEILSLESHKKFSNWIKSTGFKPALTIHHQPSLPDEFWINVFRNYLNDVSSLQRIVDKVFAGYSVAHVEHVYPVNGFATFAAKVDEGKEEAAEKLVSMDGIGMSHGLIAFGSPDSKVIDTYYSYELSGVKTDRAANIFTGFGGFLGNRGKSYMDEDAKQIFSDLFGEEYADDLDRKTQKLTEELEGVLAYKTVKGEKMSEKEQAQLEEHEEIEEEEVQEQEVETSEELEEEAPQTDSYEVLRSRLAKDFSLENLGLLLKSMKDKIDEQEETIKDLQELRKEVSEIRKSQDEKVAEQFIAPNWSGFGYSASQSDKSAEAEKPNEENAPKGSEELQDVSGFRKAIAAAMGVDVG